MAKVLRVSPRSPEGPGRSASVRRPGPAEGNRWWAVAALVFVFLALVVSVAPRLDTAQQLVAPPGTIWTGPDVHSPHRVAVHDEALAQEQRASIEQRHAKVFTYDPEVETRAVERLNRLVQMARSTAAANGQTSVTEFRQLVSERLGLQLMPETAAVLLANAFDERVESDLQLLLKHYYSRGMTDDKGLLEAASRQRRLRIIPAPGADVTTSALTAETILEYPGETFRQLESSYLPGFRLSRSRSAAYADLARQLVRPNVTYDRAETNSRRLAQLAAVNPVRTVERGELLVRQRDIVSEFQSEALAQIAEEKRHFDQLRAVGAALCVALVLAFVVLYARQFSRDTPFSARSVLMAAMPVALAVCLGRVAINLGGEPLLGAYVFPAGTVGMLSVVLFGARFAIVLVVAACTLFGVATGMNFPYVFASLAGGFTGVAGLARMKERRDLLLTGVSIGLVNSIAFLSISLALDPEQTSAGPLVGAFVNGLICFALTAAAVPLLETLFHITTDMRLMELTAGYHPLLREMEERAPGSFQHSLNVSKLAESAAEAIGARYLLVRAGAYFHDIGKMLKPKYYIENQVTPEERRIHSRLSPYMSTLIIKNHVKDGIELARKHNIPDLVMDFIPQHHGTTLIQYFYAEALRRAEPTDTVHEEEFRYSGPKPQTIEAAILMLADTVDATATAKLARTTMDEDELRRMVRDSIMDKFQDGQFDECNLTLRDLHLIRESFVRSLMSRFHQRIEYPDMPKRAERDAPRDREVARTVAAKG